MDDYFSNRTNWPLEDNEFTTIRKKLEAEKINVIDLTVSNPTQCGFDFPHDKILQGFQTPENLIYHPDSKGLLSARESICEDFHKRKVRLNPEQIILTASTSEAYAYIFRLLCNVDEEVVFPQPSYPLFNFLSELNDVRMIYYSYVYQNGRWRIDFNQLQSQLTEKTKAICIVNPNNPTGSYVSSDELLKLTEICQTRRLALISDDVFFDFSFNPDASFASIADNQSVLNFTFGGLSKMMALPQMKLSWIVVNGPKDLLEAAVARLEVIADTYLSVNTPSQNALSLWFSVKDDVQNQICQRVRNNRQFLSNVVLPVNGVELLNADGGWSAVLSLPEQIDEEQWALSLLKNDHVVVFPGFFFDFQDQPRMVISLLLQEDQFQAGIVRLVQRLSA